MSSRRINPMKWAVWVLLALLLIVPVSANKGTVKLLALLDDNGNSTGILADLSLETTQGYGRVFLETFPLTKIATQVSLQLAKQIACDELDTDCSTTDFLYTIQASPGIIGGPSAGAAASVLAAALLDGRKLDPTVAMTGTINSGGLIGPVGGVNYKIEAAAKGGIKTVLIPAGTAVYKDGNDTVDLIELGKKLGIAVVEVATLDDALTYFTGKSIDRPDHEFVLDKNFENTMKAVSQDLCDRAKQNALVPDALNLTLLADTYYAQAEYYASASYCFRAALKQKEAELKGITKKEFDERLVILVKQLSVQEKNLQGQPLQTMTDLQTFMLVQERIAEAQETVVELIESSKVPNTGALAYAEERAYSAQVWSKFFGAGGKTFVLNNQTLANSCFEKINEAEERFAYVESFYPDGLKQTRKTLDRAEARAKSGDFIVCLHDASRAKSEADILLSVTGVEESRVQDIIDIKLNVTQRSLAKAQAQGIFPLIGYSYFEYANALRTEDPYSALLFAEYANELSGLDVYFEQSNLPRIVVPWSQVGLVVAGILIGAGVSFLTLNRAKQSFRKKR